MRLELSLHVVDVRRGGRRQEADQAFSSAPCQGISCKLVPYHLRVSGVGGQGCASKSICNSKRENEMAGNAAPKRYAWRGSINIIDFASAIYLGDLPNLAYCWEFVWQRTSENHNTLWIPTLPRYARLKQFRISRLVMVFVDNGGDDVDDVDAATADAATLLVYHGLSCSVIKVHG